MKNYNGAVADPRPLEEKQKDFSHSELAYAVYTNWKEKPQEEWKKYKILNQDGSFMCVAFTARKMLGIENQKETKEYVDFSAKDIYSRRYNKPGGGMWGQDALKIMCDYGATLEQNIPSENLNETQANEPFTRTGEDEKIARLYRGGGYITRDLNTIDQVAGIIEGGHPVMLHFWFSNDEWTDKPVIKYKDLTFDNSAHHSVTAVDYFIHDGQKCLLIEDSWGKFGEYQGQRIINENWFNKRCFFKGYVLDLPNELGDTKPHYTFNKIMKYGQTSIDIKHLQKCLKYEGIFPNIEPTGYYGGITRKAVKDFQIKHGIKHNEGWQVGPLTLQALNRIYE